MKCSKCETVNPADSKFCKECATALPSSEKPQISVTRTLETTADDFARGTLFAGRYEIIEELGAGGMGAVYRAHDTKLNEEVALKLIRPEIAADKRTVERFRNEIRIARKISHPNVCRTHDLGEEGKTLYLTMEYVRGEDLKSLIHRTKTLSVGTTLAITRQIAEGLGEAHKQGITHRDLKPANVMIDKDGQAKIMDFGIARSLHGAGTTAEGAIIGTPEYMSPEQVEGKPADGRADLYALGIILFEMVTGRVPFEGETAFSIANKHKSELPPVPKKLAPQIPEGLSRLILRCLEKDRAKRYQTTEELISDLGMVEDALPTAERLAPRRKTITHREVMVTFSLRKLLVPGLIALAVVVIGAASFFTLRKSGPGLDPDLVAVAVFENQTGDASLDPLGRMASDWISQGLSQIGGLKVVPTMSVPQLSPMAKPGEKTSPALSPLQFLAEQTGAGMVVSGTYYLAGGEIQFLSSIMDTRNRKLIRSLEPVKGSLADRMDVIEKLRQLIMGALAADLGFSFGDWMGVRPPSYETYQEFILGMNSYGSDVAKTIGHMEKAVKLDPGFMPAHLWLARCYSNIERWDKAVSILDFMDQNRDKLTPEMALFLDRLKAESQGKYEEALRALLELRKLAPREALYTFAAAATELGINKPRQAIDLFEKAEVPEYWLKIGTGLSWFNNWSAAHYFLGNYKKALEVIRRARKYYPDALTPMTIEARALAALGRIEEVKKVVDESLLSRSAIGTRTAGRVMLAAAQELRLRGYQEAFKDMAGRAVEWHRERLLGKEATEQQRYELAAALYVAEQWEEAGTLIEKLRSEKPDDIDYLGYGGVLAARRGDKEDALKISEELKRIDRPFIFGEQTYWRARIAALLGMKEEAVELLRQSFAQGKYYDVFIILEADLDPLRDYAPFRELMKPKG
ncbi:MAG: protein kinase [Candidatus Aminicenantes bacterium]|nr:protein kinase [Candidatus Aminicenantes bacterium]